MHHARKPGLSDHGCDRWPSRSILAETRSGRGAIYSRRARLSPYNRAHLAQRVLVPTTSYAGDTSHSTQPGLSHRHGASSSAYGHRVADLDVGQFRLTPEVELAAASSPRDRSLARRERMATEQSGCHQHGEAAGDCQPYPQLRVGRCIRMARRGSSKVTSAKVAKQASKALSDGRSSARTKSIAASALAQAKGKK